MIGFAVPGMEPFFEVKQASAGEFVAHAIGRFLAESGEPTWQYQSIDWEPWHRAFGSRDYYPRADRSVKDQP